MCLLGIRGVPEVQPIFLAESKFLPPILVSRLEEVAIQQVFESELKKRLSLIKQLLNLIEHSGCRYVLSKFILRDPCCLILKNLFSS